MEAFEERFQVYRLKRNTNSPHGCEIMCKRYILPLCTWRNVSGDLATGLVGFTDGGHVHAQHKVQPVAALPLRSDNKNCQTMECIKLIYFLYYEEHYVI